MAERIAFVGATDGHFAKTVSVERLRHLQPDLSERLHGISSLQPLAKLCAQLDAFAPTMGATYPSAAVQLVQERQAGRLKAVPREIWAMHWSYATCVTTLPKAATRRGESPRP